MFSCIYLCYWSIRLNKTRKTQQMCDEAVDNCLAPLKFISDWFITSKIIEEIDNALHADDDILFYNEDFDSSHMQKHILAADLDKIQLDNDNNFYEDDSDAIIHIRLLVWFSNFKKRKALKKKWLKN